MLPRKDRLAEDEFRRYRVAYCGLCRNLKRRYGTACRFMVNYDMTFLYFLLAKEKEASTIRCFCPARPYCKRECMAGDPALDYVTDLTVLLSYRKLMDARKDSHGMKKIGAKLGLVCCRRFYKKALALHPEEDEVFAQQLGRLEVYEAENCRSIDRVADTFATLLQACSMAEEEPTRRRVLQTLLYHVGRYLYLVDALDDLSGDLKDGNYNPLALRYGLVDGKLSSEAMESLKETIEASISMAASALELLDRTANKEILENIIYYGLPSVLRSVSKGSFRKRRSKDEGSL
ncbi:MAG: hypothetical protein IKT58_04030 [Oscillospiraceae bacterium]|nr:hypothetical protein [Oscillospiraceae bacterium]